jgi:glycosyltransferase involved in cell wall biosynthesis
MRAMDDEKGSKIRVLMLMRQFFPLTGGYQNQALHLAQEMRRRSLDVQVVTQRRAGLPRSEVHEGVVIHRVFAFPRGHLASFSYLAFSFFWMIANRRAFDVIQANRSTSGLVAGLIGTVLGKAVVCKLTRGDEIEDKGFRATWWGNLKLFCLRRTVDRFVAITAGIHRDLLELGVSAGKVVRIPNGVPLAATRELPLERESVRQEFGWSSNTSVVTFVGRLVEEKGVDWLLEVWSRVAARDPNARLLVVGDGPERARLEHRAQTIGVESTVAFAGRRGDVPRLLAASDLFVLPSRKEGNSNALLEAMACGLPVVVANDSLGGNRELVNHQDDGFVVELGDTDTFAETVLQLLRDPLLRREIGLRGRKKIEEKCSIESVAGRYCALYRDLLRAAGSNGAA